MDRGGTELHQPAGRRSSHRHGGELHRQHVDERGRDLRRQGQRHVQFRDERRLDELEEVRKQGVGRERAATRARDVGPGQPARRRVGDRRRRSDSDGRDGLHDEPGGQGDRCVGSARGGSDRDLHGAGEWGERHLRRHRRDCDGRLGQRRSRRCAAAHRQHHGRHLLRLCERRGRRLAGDLLRSRTRPRPARRPSRSPRLRMAMSSRTCRAPTSARPPS